MRSLIQKTLSTAGRRLRVDRDNVPSAARRPRPETNADGRQGPSAMVMRHELESFRRAQGAAYWHHDRRAG
jgi:hypothetical protein